MGSEKPVYAECGCRGCDAKGHVQDPISGHCSKVTPDIEDSMKFQGWMSGHSGPPENRNYYLCRSCGQFDVSVR